MKLVAAAVVAVIVASGCKPTVAGDVAEGEGGGAGEGGTGEGEGEGDVGGDGEGDVGGEGEGGEGEGDVGGEGEGGEGEGGVGGEGEGEGAITDGYGPYDVDGPGGVDSFTVDVDNTDNGDSFSLLCFVPAGAGPHPVVSLSPGLLQPAEAYTTFSHRMASYGVAVVVRGDPGAFTNTTDVVDDIEFVVQTYLPAQNADVASPLFGRLDMTRVGLAGHSRGGKASLIAAEDMTSSTVKAWFGLDPVDADTLSGGRFAVTDVATVGIPLAFLGASISSSCSPANANSDVLFAEALAPAVELIGIGAGHTQLEDQDACSGCGFCTPGGEQPDDVVLRYTTRYITAFFARELTGDSAVGAAFEGAGVALDVDDGLIARNVK